MLIYRLVNKIPLFEHWFSEFETNVPFYYFSVIRADLNNSFNKPWFYFSERKSTLISHLKNKSDDDILAGMRKKLRYDIKKILLNEAFECKVITDDIFVSHFNEFAPTKSLPILSDKRFKENLKQHFFTGVYVNEILVASHCYIYSDRTCRLLYSALHNMNTEVVDSNQSQSANKLLHFYDMIKFRDRNVFNYDWGGVSTGSLAGIDNFKKGFGGEKINYEDHYSPLYYFALKFFK